MKKIKFPLEMRDGKPVRELEELQEYFDLERAVEYFANGRLQKWLENSYYDDILEEIRELTGEEADFVERFTEALGVKAETEQMNVQELMKRAALKEKLKRLFPEDRVEELIPVTADSQESMESLLSAGCKKIYLLTGTFYISRDIHNVEFEGIDNPEIILEVKDRNLFAKQRIRFSGVTAADENTKRMMEMDDLDRVMLSLLDVLELQIGQMK